jgi:hypothetical protein
MKKLIVLLGVLAIASTANATLQISVNGIKEPVNSEIWAEPSVPIHLDIWTDADIAPQVGETYWALAAQTTGAAISGGIILEPYASDETLTIKIDDDARDFGWVPLPEGENGVWGSVFSTGGSIPVDATIYDEILFHCQGPGDVTVTLYETDFVNSEPIDSVIIHQIPEPATVMLLGLGGLLLRRRK